MKASMRQFRSRQAAQPRQRVWRDSLYREARTYQAVTARFRIRTEFAPQFIDVTDRVKHVVQESEVWSGQVVVFTEHTTAAIRINEAEPELLQDFVAFLDKVAPTFANYRHDDFTVRTVNMTPDERPNAHAHCRCLLMGASETIPIFNGQPRLGTWQRIFLVELDHPRDRTVVVQVSGQAR